MIQIKNKLANNRLTKNIVGNYIMKILAMIVSFFLTPAYMNFFYSNKVLGMWFTLVAILNWIMMFDFGIGAGVRNNLVLALEKKDSLEIAKIIVSGMVANTTIVIFFCVIQHFVVESINWYTVLGIGEEDVSISNLKLIIHILAIGISLRMFASFVSHIYYAMQKAVASSIMAFFSNLLILLYMIIIPSNGSEQDIVGLAIVHAICYNIPVLIAVIDIFCVKLKNVKFRINCLDRRHLQMITGVGVNFFYLQILITLAFGVKEIMITWFAGAGQVVDYNVYQKVIGLAGTLFALALVPIWSEVTERYVQGRIDDILILYKKGEKIIFLIGIGQFILVFLFPIVNKIWLGNNAIKVSYVDLFIFAIYNLEYMLIMLNYNFLCGMSKIKELSLTLTIMVVLNFLLSYFGSFVWKSWAMVMAASVIASIPALIVTTITIFKIKMND
jgi:O-antigen/teichoic acid export membrane protein